jgi:exopolyphosphatase/guanosine-5'-triphosphate,3'-diphosphate pyrophosphatase
MHKLVTANNENKLDIAPLQTDKFVSHIVAVDLGSNSFHIIIAREQDGCLQIMYKQKNPVELAAGLDQHNILSHQAIDKAISCLHDFNLSLSQLPSSAIRIVATHALRKAENIDYFLKKAKQVLPYPIEIISGKLEAELIYKGVAHTQAIHDKTLIIDIGGGSTEFVIGSDFTPHITDSLEMGCISFQRKFFFCGTITQKKLYEAKQFSLLQLNKIADKYLQCKWDTALGTSGSIKVISHVMLELYGDYKVSKDRLDSLEELLISWQHCDSIALRSIEPRRRPLLAGAVAILSSCFQKLAITELCFSAGGVREGVLYDLSESRTDIDTRERTVQSLIKLHHVDQSFSHRVLWQLNDFRKKLDNTSAKLTDSEFQLLHWSVQLHELGIAINSRKRQLHGAYIIEHSHMPGFTEQEQNKIALLISNHRGKIKLPLDQINPIINERLPLLIQLLRLVILLTQGRLPQRITPNKLSYQDGTLILSLSNQHELILSLESEIQKQKTAGLKLIVETATQC